MRRERGPYRYRRLQVLEGYGDDPYRPRRKPPGPAQCPRCGAVYRDGRWSWSRGAAPRAKLLCPACRRIAEDMPAGYLTLAGEYFRGHRAEVLGRVVHCAEQERAEHPLERIIAMREQDGEMLVTTTSTHLARLIGHALKRAFKGDLRMTYGRDENLLRVRWSRAA
jgi:hypothetical protein